MAGKAVPTRRTDQQANIDQMSEKLGGDCCLLKYGVLTSEGDNSKWAQVEVVWADGVLTILLILTEVLLVWLPVKIKSLFVNLCHPLGFDLKEGSNVNRPEACLHKHSHSNCSMRSWTTHDLHTFQTSALSHFFYFYFYQDSDLCFIFHCNVIFSSPSMPFPNFNLSAATHVLTEWSVWYEMVIRVCNDWKYSHTISF